MNLYIVTNNSQGKKIEVNGTEKVIAGRDENPAYPIKIENIKKNDVITCKNNSNGDVYLYAIGIVEKETEEPATGIQITQSTSTENAVYVKDNESDKHYAVVTISEEDAKNCKDITLSYNSWSDTINEVFESIQFNGETHTASEFCSSAKYVYALLVDNVEGKSDDEIKSTIQNISVTANQQ